MYSLRHLSDVELRKHAAQRAISHLCKDDRESLLIALEPFAALILVNAPKPLPVAPPPFSLTDIQKAIPSHLFKRSLFRSMMHVVHDVVIASSLFYLSTYIPYLDIPDVVKAALWVVYWICQGIVLTGVWVLAHECGHQVCSKIITSSLLLCMYRPSLNLNPLTTLLVGFYTPSYWYLITLGESPMENIIKIPDLLKMMKSSPPLPVPISLTTCWLKHPSISCTI